jgi:hypothetical protein
MPTSEHTIGGFLPSRESGSVTVHRLPYWNEQLGSRELTDITEADVDTAVVRLAESGQPAPRRGKGTE